MLKNKPLALRVSALMAAAMFLFTSCVPENVDPAADLPKGAIPLSAESFRGTGGTKLGVDALGADVYFIEGDSLWVMGVDNPVIVQKNGNTAYIQIPDDLEGQELVVVYPYNIVTTHSTADHTVTINLPGHHTYSTYTIGNSSKRQKVRAPLLAHILAAENVSTNANRTLKFKHLISAITLNITNNTSTPIKLSEITINSEGTNTGINGALLHYQIPVDYTQGTVDAIPDEGLIDGVAYPDSVYTTLIMHFNDQDECIVPANATSPVYIQIPILPIRGSSKPCPFVISIKGTPTLEGLPKFQFHYEKMQTTGAMVLNQGELVYAPVTFDISGNELKSDGVFSISGSEKIFFSHGNLRYKVPTASVISAGVEKEATYFSKTDYWSFFDEQYQIATDRSTSVSDDRLYGASQEWIDLFAYGANGKTLHPRQAAASGSTALPHNPTVAIYSWVTSNINNTDNDWGVRPYDKQWFTLTKDQWDYLLSRDRIIPGASGAGPAYGIATVNSKKGLLIFPDKYYLENDSLTSTVIDLATWETLEQNGVVFLPSTGLAVPGRRGTVAFTPAENVNCYYWSSTAKYYLKIDGSTNNPITGATPPPTFVTEGSNETGSTHNLYAVRLVHPAATNE